MNKQKFLCFIEDGSHDIEFFATHYRLLEDYDVDIVSSKTGTVNCKFGIPCKNVNLSYDYFITEFSNEKELYKCSSGLVSQYVGCFIPGGYRGPEQLRINKKCLAILKEFDKQRRVIGLICHAAQVAISADIVKGRTILGYDDISVDIRNAGGIYHDDWRVARDMNIVSAKHYNDIPEFNKLLIKVTNELFPKN